jgi:phosphatidylethanolamine-binding protein (PEBP) family uncharacterized protein
VEDSADLGSANRARQTGSAREGLNDLHEATYVGLCPPPGQTHHYRFTLLALSKSLNLPYGSAVRTVLRAAKPFVLDTATFVAAYHRSTPRTS